MGVKIDYKLNLAKNYNTDYFKVNAVEVYKKVLNGDIKGFPFGFWTSKDVMNNCAKITRYLIEEELEWTDEDIKLSLSPEVFEDMMLSKMLTYIFKGNFYDAILNAFPEKNLKPWEMKYTCKGFWKNDDYVEQTLNWLFFEKLKWDTEDIVSKVSKSTFENSNLSSLYHYRFKNKKENLLKYLGISQNSALFKEKELNSDKEVADFLLTIFKDLKWNHEKIAKNFNEDIIIKNGLKKVFQDRFNSDIFQMLDFVKKDEFICWELKFLPVFYFESEKNQKEALNWLFKANLNWDVNSAIKRFNDEIFRDNGLGYIYKNIFNNNMIELLRFVYADEFDKYFV